MQPVNISDFNRAPPAAVPPRLRQKRKRNRAPYSEMESLQKRVAKLQQGEIQSNLNQLKIIELLEGIKQDLENVYKTKQSSDKNAESNSGQEQVSASHVSVADTTAVRSPESAASTIAQTDSLGTTRLGVATNPVEEQVNTPTTDTISITQIEAEASSSIPVIKESGISEKTVKLDNGTICIGSFIGDFIKEGTKSFPGGIVMTGIFDDLGLVEGKIEYPNGEMQVGHFIGDKITKGKIIFPGKQVQEGEFVQGKIFKGKLTFLDKNMVFEGTFNEKGWLSEGKITFPDKVVVEGFFNNNGRLEGPGKISQDGRIVQQGIFLNGKLMP